MYTDARVLRVTLLSLPYLVPRLCAFLCPRTNFAFGWAGEFLGISKKKIYRTVYGDIHENNLNWRSIVRGERFCYIYGFQIREEGKTMASFKKQNTKVSLEPKKCVLTLNELLPFQLAKLASNSLDFLHPA